MNLETSFKNKSKIKIKLKDFEVKKYKSKNINPQRLDGYEQIFLEAQTLSENLCIDSQNGFIQALHFAYWYHLSFCFSPDHIWLLIAQQISKYEDKTGFLGKIYDLPKPPKVLEVFLDNLSKSEFKKKLVTFVPLIKKNIPQKLFNMINQDFSTSGIIENLCKSITLMETVKKYFKYRMIYMCYIPQIEIIGEKDDWEKILKNVKEMAKEFGKETELCIYLKEIIPILEEFVNAFDGKIDKSFWDSCYKYEATRIGSGGQKNETISGWIARFFYFQATKSTEKQSYGFELDPYNLSSGYSVAPVELDILGKISQSKFYGGFCGVSQREDGSIIPGLGWYMLKEKK